MVYTAIYTGIYGGISRSLAVSVRRNRPKKLNTGGENRCKELMKLHTEVTCLHSELGTTVNSTGKQET